MARKGGRTMAKKQPSRKKYKYSRHLVNELQLLERELLAALQKRLEKARSTSAHDPAEFMDMVTDGEIDELAARIVDSDSLKIDEIEEALKLLREGHYGVCQGCGKRIAKRRLKARPFATLCIGCKQRQEATAGGVRKPTVHGDIEVDVDVGDRHDEEEHVAYDELFREVKTSDTY